MNKYENTDTQQEYVLGSNEQEISRLAFQHEVWLPQASQGWQRAGFQSGDTLVDIGSGPGNASFNLAQIVGNTGKIYAIDSSERYINYLQAQLKFRGITNIIAKAGNVEELNLPDESINGAFSRWVLCFLGNPEAVVAGVSRALKSGSVFLAHDYYDYEGFSVAPKNEIINRVFHAIAESFRMAGGNPDIGSRLPGMMSRNGLEVREINLLTRLARPGSLLWKWLELFFKGGYVSTLVEKSLITSSEQKDFERAFDELTNDSNSFLSTPPMVEIIGVKK